MSSVRTRRQAAAVSSPATPAPQKDQITMNGNGAAPDGEGKEVHPKENIFLFWPNVIGSLFLRTSKSSETMADNS
jgi:CDP-diacylglycerol--inositol 3-phosphatidyltransferase